MRELSREAGEMGRARAPEQPIAFAPPPKRTGRWRWLLYAIAVGGGAWAVGFGLYVAALAGKISRGEISPSPRRPSGNGALELSAAGVGRPSLGAASAPVVVVEFLDFECPFCRQAEPVVDAALAAPELAGSVRFVFRHFPLADIHPRAIAAAEAAECAYRQGKFAAMRRLLFQHQDRLLPADLVQYARQAGLEEPAFTACLDRPDTFAVIEQDWRDGINLGVKGTPTYFVGRKRMEGALTMAALRQAITSELTDR